MSCFVASPSGIKGFNTYTAGLIYHIKKGSERPLAHIVILLLEIFKVYTGSQKHIHDVVNTTEYKLKVR